MFSKSLIEYTEKHLVASNVNLLKNTMVKAVEKDHIVVMDKEKKLQTIPYGIDFFIQGLLVWATGNSPRSVVSGLIKSLPASEQNQRLAYVLL